MKLKKINLSKDTAFAHGWNWNYREFSMKKSFLFSNKNGEISVKAYFFIESCH
jgi:hypothetical protein